MTTIKSKKVNGAHKVLEIPKMQWAQVFEKTASALLYTQIPVPSISSDEILVQIHYSGVCHTDLHAWKGDWPLETKKDLVGGHEGAGVVVARGGNVSRVSIGDRVGVQWMNDTCGSCEFCDDGDQPLCPSAKISGYTVNGTFQQYCVCKATNAVRIPDEISLDEAAPILCAGVTVYKALKESNLKPGQIVAVVGAGGGLGTLACQYAKALGYRVLALSAGSSKEAMLVKEIGVDYFVDYIASQERLIPEIQELTRGGPHAAIVVASVERPIGQAIQYIRPKGTVVVVGLPKNAIIKADLFSTVVKQKMVKGSYVGSSIETEEALAIYANNRFRIQYQITSLEELPTVFEKMEQGKMQGRTVLKIPSPETVVNGSIGISPKFTPSEYNMGTLLASRLEEIGIRDYFVVPGDFNLTLIDQILKNPNLRMVGCCNELNAGYAADGYSRSSPARTAVVFVTFMVGGLSLLNAIAGAYSERLRVIVISGAPPSDTFGQDDLIHHTTGLKERDQAIRMFEHVTTASVRLDPKADPAFVLDQALLRCLENSLPVYIEIPANIVEYPCDAPKPLILRQPQVSLPSVLRDTLDLFTSYWQDAQSPVILVGPLARHSLTRDTLLSVIEKLGCPVFCQPDAKSIVPEVHPQFQGTFWGSISDSACLDVMMGADLWVGIGTRSTDYNLVKGPTPPLIDLSLDHLRAPNGSLIGPATMADLSGCIVASNLTSYCMKSNGSASHAEDPPKWIDMQTSISQPLTRAGILKEIQSLLLPNDTLIAETGDSWFNAQMIKLPPGVDYQMQMLYGSIGWALPATLGSQLAQPQGRSILMIGDGSFQVTAQELSTMIRLKTNSVIFIFNNMGYRIESAIHDGPYNYVSNWNYANFAETMCNVSHSPGNGNNYLTEAEKRGQNNPALLAMRIKTHDDLLLAVDRVLREPSKLAVLECCIHPWDISETLARFGQAVSSKE